MRSLNEIAGPGTRRQRDEADAPSLAADDRISPVEHAAMHRAFDLALRGPRGGNPQVGCVLVGASGTTLGEGWHAGIGQPHAEAVAILDARRRGHDLRGATAVVTLEPCDHTGRTPPCSRALIDAGIARAVVSAPDPTPEATGGVRRLREAGVEVVTGALADRGQRLVDAWLRTRGTGRPYVIAKIASTLDGRVAAADGTSRWITSAAARAHAHRQRAVVDAIVVGTGTALRDDPRLTARGGDGAPAPRQPLRVVVGHRELPAGARLRDGRFLALRTHDAGEVVEALHARGERLVLVEGGPTLLTAFLRAGLVDELHAYLAPVLLGAGPASIGDLGIGTIAEARRFAPIQRLTLDPDLLVVSAAEDPSPIDHPRHQEQ